MKKMSLAVALAVALLLAGCAMGGGERESTGPDPIVGIWELTETNPPQAISEVLVITPSGLFVAGMEAGGYGGCALGTWSRTSPGHYGYVTYSNDSGSGSPSITSGIVSGDTLTVPDIQVGDDTATFTFTRVSVSYSSSDPLLGWWDLVKIDTGDGWAPASEYNASAQMAVHESGLFVGGISADAIGGFVGKWAQTSTGTYDYTAYSNAGMEGGQGIAQSGIATLSDHLEIPGFYLGPEFTRPVWFEKRSISYSNSESILGRWRLTAIDNEPPGEVSWEFAFLEHGAFAGGMADGDGTGCITGAWCPSETAGAYDYIVYPYASPDSPVQGTVTVAGNALTLPDINMGGVDRTLTFTRE